MNKYQSPNINNSEINIYYEHVFSKPKYNDENKYVYDFPKHWLDNPGKKSIEIRNVKVIPAARNLGFTNFKITNGNNTFYPQLEINLDNTDTMNNFNLEIEKYIKEKLIEDSSVIKYNEFSIKYNYAENCLEFYITSNDHDLCFIFDVVEQYTTNDFRNMINLYEPNTFPKNNPDLLFIYLAKFTNGIIGEHELKRYLSKYPNVEVDIENNKLIGFKFLNVWNRGTTLIKSNISSLAEDSLMCVANELLTPPKHYTIHGFNTCFEISLYDSSHNDKIILPLDGKDKIIVEAILISI